MRFLFDASQNNGVILEIIYEAKGGLLSQRRIRIKSYNDQHFIAFCLERKQTRMFRMDRLLSIAPIKHAK
ncbi:hypothetical protein [Halalkalibacter sp. APA_J-10(15)]|uniref:hypothetical protein n=1 Tax=unclassified Halalkalibacter TaxID=2893063 RepID=UPI001FF19FC5|nr:hypothetical protein [Halalkalibacter sp. APA_J-10(15)]MCK0471447.1 hypothetical protein [Halalkalibacter sp. APA_J-10(15)]